MGVYPTFPVAGEGDHVPVLSPAYSPSAAGSGMDKNSLTFWTNSLNGRLGGGPVLQLLQGLPALRRKRRRRLKHQSRIPLVPGLEESLGADMVTGAGCVEGVEVGTTTLETTA